MNSTVSPPVCTTCAANVKYGDNGYCNGVTGDPAAPCTQKSNNKTWGYTCPTNTCMGLCGSGSCGIGEWFFSQNVRRMNQLDFMVVAFLFLNGNLLSFM